MAFEDDIIY